MIGLAQDAGSVAPAKARAGVRDCKRYNRIGLIAGTLVGAMMP